MVERVICPRCGKRVSAWEDKEGKTIEVNGYVYHKACVLDLKIKDMVEGKWIKPK